jgi:hypothetical protein
VFFACDGAIGLRALVDGDFARSSSSFNNDAVLYFSGGVLLLLLLLFKLVLAVLLSFELFGVVVDAVGDVNPANLAYLQGMC